MPIVFDEVLATIEGGSAAERSAGEAAGQAGAAEGRQAPSEPPAEIVEQLRRVEVRTLRLKAD